MFTVHLDVSTSKDMHMTWIMLHELLEWIVRRGSCYMLYHLTCMT